MTRLPGSPPEPFLIITVDEYRRAFTQRAEPEPAPVPAAAPIPVPVPSRGSGRARSFVFATAISVLMLAGGGAAAYWFIQHLRPRPAPVVARVPEAPRKRVLAPSRKAAAPAPGSISAFLPEEPEEAVPGPAARPAPKEPPPLWNGGRGWVSVRLRVRQQSRVWETEHRVTLVWDGSRYAVERPASGPAEPWMDRLDLLFQLPSEEEGWVRRIVRSGEEVLRVRAMDVACRVVEGEDCFLKDTRRFRCWYSDEFPPGSVQAWVKSGDMILESRVLDFGPSTESVKNP